jgi:hypothetical protein
MIWVSEKLCFYLLESGNFSERFGDATYGSFNP